MGDKGAGRVVMTQHEVQPMASTYAEANRRAWDYLADVNSSASDPWEQGSKAEYRAWLDEFGWLPWPELGTVLLLCGAGGQQGPALAGLGLEVTVVDLSESQLEVDRRVAAERGLEIETLCADAQDLSVLRGRTFDLVYQPVSTCYLPDPPSVYRSVRSLLRPGGLYLSDHWNPVQIQLSVDHRWDGTAYRVAHPSGSNEPLRVTDPSTAQGPDCMYFAHRLQDLLGGICDAGFVIERLAERGLVDPTAEPGSPGHLGCYLAPFYEVLARRTGPAPARRRPGARTRPAEEPRQESPAVPAQRSSARLARPLVRERLLRDDLAERWSRRGFVILRDVLDPGLPTRLGRESAVQQPSGVRSTWSGHAVSDDGSYVSGGMEFHSASPGPVLTWLHQHPDLTRLLQAVTGDPRISANQNVAYMYYEPGCYIDLHTDVPECEATVLTSVRGRTPPLVAYPRLLGLSTSELLAVARRSGGRPGGGVLLEVPVGGLLILDGRRLPHRRAQLGDGQRPCGIAALCFAVPTREGA
jgi:SAM-dependent methyltransferase